MSPATQDLCLRAHDRGGRLRAVACSCPGIVTAIRGRQETDDLATIALGRLAVGAALMAVLEQVRVALAVEGNGPLARLQARPIAAEVTITPTPTTMPSPPIWILSAAVIATATRDGTSPK